MILFLWASLYADAQTIILPLYNPSDDFTTEGAYYKDLDGDMDKMVGTWEYENGNEHLTISFQKKTYYHVSFPVEQISYYQDALYGEYMYVDSNGIELISTLNEMNNFYPKLGEHLIYGSYIKDKYDRPYCEECGIDERRISLQMEDPERPYINYEIGLRYIPIGNGNNTEQIRIIIIGSGGMVPEGSPDDDRLPTIQELTLNKVKTPYINYELKRTSYGAL